MKKIKIFRNIIANGVILIVLLGIIGVTYAGGVLNVFSSKTIDAYYHGNLNKRNVSLMINVYWGTEYINDMLKVFKENDIKVTFFVGGCWVGNNSEMLQAIYHNGHEIGNHGYFHKDHKSISLEKNQEEIYLTHKIVKENIGIEMELFAPPSGSYNNDTLSVAYNLGYKTIMWTKDTIDWRDKNTTLIYNRAVAKPNNGDLILMHPTKNTLEALPDIINFYKSNGYNLVTVTENIT